jgi:hypothetical protein
MFLPHVKSNACASMALRKQFRFHCKEESLCEVAQVSVVDIHHHVLKSTTSDRNRSGKNCMVHLVYLVCLICLAFWSDKINQMNQIDEIDPINLSRREP